jgi:SAM-dependent methyltransferase
MIVVYSWGVSDHSDPYALSAPYIDPLIADFWRAVSPALAAELRALAARSGPVVDVGAGSGRGVRVICSALPGVPVLAVEPSPAMRTALLARLTDDPVLGGSVTVLAADAQGVELPGRVRALVAMNVIGHLAPEERARLWRRIAGCLEPGGAVFVNNQPPHTPVTVPLARGGTFRIGEHRYEGWVEAEPAGDDRVRWHMTYKTLRDDRVVSETAVDYDWWVMSDEQLLAECAAHGLTARRRAGDGASAFHVLEGPA